LERRHPPGSELRRVHIGAIIPNDGPAPGRFGVGTMAAAAEDAGAASLWVSDHLLLAEGPTTDYPYAAGGAPDWPPDIDYYEALLTCGALAAATSTCRVGPAVLVLPQRNVLEVAKMVATLDQLSGGRFVLGAGAGWDRREFAALGYSYETRGARFDEMLHVLRDCWSGHPGEFRGREIAVPGGVVLKPVPHQKPGPPILVGGMTARARRRAAELGDGWLALASAEDWDGQTLANGYEDVTRQRVAHRGDQRGFETVLKLHSEQGSADAVPELVREAAALGFDEVAVEPPWLEGIEAGRRFIETVLKAVRA
jgi:probable F420-dependent oxidoreductase